MPKLILLFKGTELRVYPVKDGEMTIGRDPECDICIDSLAVSPVHAKISTTEGSSSISDMNSNSGIFVNRQQINQQPLQFKDMIRVGKHTLVFERGDIEAEAETDPESGTITVRDESFMASSQDVPLEPISPEPMPDPMPDPLPEPVPEPAAPAEEIPTGWLQIMSGSSMGKTFKLKASLTDLGKMGLNPALISKRNDGYFISNLDENISISVDSRNVEKESTKLNDGDIIEVGDMMIQFYYQDE